MRSVLVLSTKAPLCPQALGSGACALLLRLDGVSREVARAGARSFIDAARKSPAARPQIFVQVAPVTSDKVDDDLEALMGEGLDGVFLEACEGRHDVQQLSVKLAVREAESGLRAGELKIVALAAQTPASVFGLGAYRGASKRLVALAMDRADLPGGAQARATAAALLSLGAAAAGVSALAAAPARRGGPQVAAYADLRQEGFTGAMAFSEKEIAAINVAFGGG
jgi:citrate lyase subunit beta/citryl-CoA lyase